jgi:hypothetical protein
MVILVNFQPITGYYEKAFNKESSPENLFNKRPHSPYYILKVSAQMDGFFLKYGISKKWTIFGGIVRK